MESERNNAGKTEWCLFPFYAAEEIVKVFSYGARKYSPNNWENGCAWTDTYNSLQRHLNAWRDGEDYDQESGLLHLGHVGCNVLFLLAYKIKGWGTDDRKLPALRNIKETNSENKR